MINRIIKDLEDKYQKEFKISREVKGGWKNKKWLVNESYLIKELSKERYKLNQLESIEKSLKIQEKLYPLTPKIYTRNKRCIQTIDNINYIMMSFNKGVHKDVNTISENDLYTLGKSLARIHTVDYKTIYKGYILDDFYGILENFIKSHENPLIDQCRSIFKLLPIDILKSYEVGYTHSDFSKDNIIFGEKVTVLDFDRGRVAYPLQDVGRAIMTFMFDGQIQGHLLKAFMQGYNAIKALTANDIIKALKLIWLIEVPWWFAFDTDKEKIKEFKKEIIWITDNYTKLDQVIKEI